MNAHDEDDDVLKCPNCDEEITPIQVRVEDVQTSWGEQGYTIHGCAHCLSGRHVYMPVSLTAALLDAYWQRKIDEEREGSAS